MNNGKLILNGYVVIFMLSSLGKKTLSFLVRSLREFICTDDGFEYLAL